MYFGKNLRYLRKKNNLGQEYIAEKLGYKNYTTVQKWESGDSEPNVEKLLSISRLFNVSMDALLNSDIEESENLPSPYGNHAENMKYFADKPELMEIYKEIYNSESLQLLFDNAKDLTPEALESVLQIIKQIKGGSQG